MDETDGNIESGLVNVNSTDNLYYKYTKNVFIEKKLFVKV